ncbi:MAG: riboflavin synthase [Roseburia sp.]|nr:riboflavin synthase [Roseburia sp.]
MFTGIIEEIGTIDSVRKGSQSAVLGIRCSKVLEGTKTGDSIAVNGVCLTVTGMSGSGYTADVMAETMARSSLGQLSRGDRVNLERAMAADGRFGGHMVAGHIDGTGTIKDIRRDETAVWYTIGAGGHILRYVVEKGSIAIDGISLTVAGVTDSELTVSVIPHTQGQTNLSDRRAGDTVNLECDVVGKYIEKLCMPDKNSTNVENHKLSEEFLMENGFL